MISEDRKKHIWGVAEQMKNWAISHSLSQEEVEEYYMLGLLHDVGYEFAEPEDYRKHNIIGGGNFKEFGV